MEQANTVNFLKAGDIILYADPCEIHIWRFGCDTVRVFNGHGETVDVWSFEAGNTLSIDQAIAGCEDRFEDLEMHELAVRLGQDDCNCDVEQLESRLEYYTDEEGEQDDDADEQIEGLVKLIDYYSK